MQEHALRPNALPVDPDTDFLDPAEDSDILFLVMNIQNLASTATKGSATVQVPYGIDFYWYGATVQADVTAGGNNNVTESAIVNPIVDFQLTIASAQKRLENRGVPLSTYFGISGGERFYRPIQPRRFEGGTIIRVDANAHIAAGTTYNNLFLVLHGYTLPAAPGHLQGP